MSDEEQIEEVIPDGVAITKASPPCANIAKKGWKDGLKFGKSAPAPAKGWKNGLAFSPSTKAPEKEKKWKKK